MLSHWFKRMILFKKLLLFQSTTINQKKWSIFLFARKNYSISTVCYNILTSISLEYKFIIIILWSGNGMSSRAKLNFTTSGSAGEPQWKKRGNWVKLVVNKRLLERKH